MPKWEGDFKRNKAVVCYVSETEKAFLKKAIETLGFDSMSGFLRAIISDYLAELQQNQERQ